MKSKIEIIAFIGATVASAWLGVPSQAKADGIPPATYSGLLELNVGGVDYGPGNFTTGQNLSFSDFGSTVSTTIAVGVPSVQTQANVVSGTGGSSQTTMNYFVEVLGPVGSVLVTVQASGQVYVGPGGGSALAQLIL